MVVAGCVAAVAAAWLALATRHKDLKQMDRGDLPRLRLLSDRIKRQDIYPFE
jgi:hypothetical protein